MALSNQRVNLLLFDLPADPVNQQSQLDSVEGVDDWVLLGFFVDDLLVDVDQSVHLSDAENIKVLMDEEKFHLVEFARFSDSTHENVHHFGVHVDCWVDVESVYQNGNLVRVISQTNNKQLNELFAGDTFLFGILELLPVVLFAVHLEDDKDVLSRDKKSLSVILSNSLFDIIIDDDLLVVSLVVFSVSGGFEREGLLEEERQIQLGGVLIEGEFDKLIVTLIQELEGVLVSELDESQLAEDLRVDDSKVIVDGLIEHHMINQRIDRLTNSPYPFNPIDIDVLK